MTGQGRLARDPGRPHQTAGARAGPPAYPGPDPGTVELWASLFTNAEIGIDESRAKVAALEFLLDCQARGQTPTFGYGPGGLLSWCEGNIGGGEDRD